MATEGPQRKRSTARSSPLHVVGDPKLVAVVIPALDEEASIGATVRGFRSELDKLGWTHEVIVADNGSTDATAQRATAAGAIVVSAPSKGYGAACLAGVAALRPETDIVVFADGDGADDPEDIGALVGPILRGDRDLVIGSRALGALLHWAEPGALTAAQRFGNQLSCVLIRSLFGVSYTDLGPFRAIRREALDDLAMDDKNFGWTVQMQTRAAAAGLRVRDEPVHYRRRRGGVSKVSGDIKGSVLAGTIILRTVGQEAASHIWRTMRA